MCVAVDSSGNVFIADTINNRFREVNYATGLITTVAGNGTAGFSGDNGPATGASLNFPYALAVDDTGHLYIADHSNNRIRCVNLSTHIITTVAGNGTGGFGGDGGLATAALLGGPSGLALDASGDLFIADQWNCRIREVNLSTGIISTVAGNGNSGYSGDNGPATAASFYPTGVAVDTGGHLFIANQTDNRIREVDLATGIITTIAGNGTGAYSGDNSVATAAEIQNPLGVAADAQGNLFIADSSNNRIREVEPGWLVTIAQATSNTLATASASPSRYGQAVTFTATVTPSSDVGPTGTVQFQIDGSNAGSPAPLSGGRATYSTSTLAVGSHSVVAVYSGDGNFTGGTSPTFNQSVGQATPTMTWSTPAPITYGTALSSTQLNASASVGGTYSYSPALGTVRRAGVQTLSVTFNPTDTTDYITATATTTLNITPARLTASIAIGNKAYDGTVTATTTSRSLAGIIGLDEVSLTGGTAAFVDKNVGTSKVVTVTGLNLIGADADNYMVDIAVTVSANIIPALLTVTATAYNKVYDGTTSAGATPTIASGSLVAGDTAAFNETYNTKSVGTSRTLTAAGSVNDGNGGKNYVVTFATSNMGQITARAITVTAATNTKTYDGTTSATATPTITSGSLVAGDTAAFTETSDTKNAGTGKTLTATGSVSDGNGGKNYVVTFATSNMGQITARAITVTAATNTKTYDGTTSATATPTITSGSLVAGDTAAFTETFDTKNAGTGKTLTATGSVNDGNGGENYVVTFATSNMGQITARVLTVTANNQSRAYGAANPSLTYTFTGFVNGDTSASLTTLPTFSTTAINASHVGTYPIQAAGAVDPNYSISYVNGTLTVTPVPVAVSVVPLVTNSRPTLTLTGTAVAPSPNSRDRQRERAWSTARRRLQPSAATPGVQPCPRRPPELTTSRRRPPTTPATPAPSPRPEPWWSTPSRRRR